MHKFSTLQNNTIQKQHNSIIIQKQNIVWRAAAPATSSQRHKTILYKSNTIVLLYRSYAIQLYLYIIVYKYNCIAYERYNNHIFVYNCIQIYDYYTAHMLYNYISLPIYVKSSHPCHKFSNVCGPVQIHQDRYTGHIRDIYGTLKYAAHISYKGYNTKAIQGVLLIFLIFFIFLFFSYIIQRHCKEYFWNTWESVCCLPQWEHISKRRRRYLGHLRVCVVHWYSIQ